MPKLNTILGLERTVVLASASPRRQELLENIGLHFDTFHPSLDEPLPMQDEQPEDYVVRLAAEKCKAVVGHLIQDSIVISADTVVCFDGNILGKPKNEQDAIRMLRTLSGNMHTVYTGFSVLDMATNRSIEDYSATNVYFEQLLEHEIQGYVATGLPLDKAGAYGIQGDLGSVFVSRIEGDYFNVVGLPLNKVYRALQKFSKYS